MATKGKPTESVYRVTEVIGTSADSWEDAAKNAVKTASGTLRDLRIAEVMKMDVKIEGGKVLEYRTRLQLSFKYES
jgi:flavin-binding protein dodecin